MADGQIALPARRRLGESGIVALAVLVGDVCGAAEEVEDGFVDLGGDCGLGELA